jgi:hypothetical protein
MVVAGMTVGAPSSRWTLAPDGSGELRDEIYWCDGYIKQR